MRICRQYFFAANPAHISDGNNHPDSDSPISSETTITNEPADSEPVFGSMGSVTILGEEYDIATTTSLLIYNKEWYLKV